ncbi:hypothetical protein [Streptomyces lydicus]|uniref:hypothetical protein n=1 Tax=Streptomyces lydicus TaxID=47763 RepID=UPI0010119172|nr:hypothetical protein [Streptomyces lydicus]MCZ1012260.1 hypothetical protein [Streptomyces lydicus]
MLLAPHPLQRSGAWAAALMADRTHPHHVTTADLDSLAERIAADCDRSGHLSKDEPGWAWLVRLAGMYPQSPPVHPSRSKSTRPIGPRVRDFLGPDPDPSQVQASGQEVWPCFLCGAAGASIRWGKDRFPLSDSTSHLNNSVVYGGGYPLCRGCRVALWALPYGTAAAGHENQTVTGFDDTLEAAVTAAHLKTSLQALDERWTTWRHAPAAHDLLWQTLAALPDPQVSVNILRWTHGNRESTLEMLDLTPAATAHLARLHHTADLAELHRAARTARAHPLNLVAAPERLAHALASAPHWATPALQQLDPDDRTPAEAAEETGSAGHR